MKGAVLQSMAELRWGGGGSCALVQEDFTGEVTWAEWEGQAGLEGVERSSRTRGGNPRVYLKLNASWSSERWFHDRLRGKGDQGGQGGLGRLPGGGVLARVCQENWGVSNIIVLLKRGTSFRLCCKLFLSPLNKR